MRWVGAEGTGFIFWMFGGVVAFCLLYVPVKWLRYRSIERGGAYTTARVVGADSSYFLGGFGKEPGQEPDYYADVEFDVEDGRLFQVRLKVPEPVEVGVELPIVYDFDDPSKASQVQTERYWAKEMIASLVFALVFAAMGVGMLIAIGAIEVG